MSRRIMSVFVLLSFLFLAGCDNGSVSEPAVSKSSGLVKVCLTVGSDSSELQKSAAADGSYWTSFTYQYNAVPQWIDPAGTRIHGATDWIPISYSAGMSLGYYSPGQWVFGIRIKNGANVIYEGFSDVINVENTSVNVDVLVSKLVTEAVAGSVRIAVTAPSAVDDELSISYTGDAAGGPFTVAAESASDRYPFEYTVTGLSAGTYTFTLANSAGDIEDDIEIVMPAGAMAVISGHLDNGIWQLGYTTANVYSVNVSTTGSGSVSSNASSAAVGDRVSFRVKPSNNSRLNSLSVTCGGSNVSYTTSGSLYSFIMPEGNVSISAEFEEADTEIDINHFKIIVQSMYDSNPSATSFGRSNSSPTGAEYLGIKDVLVWYDSVNNKICWYSESGNNTLKFKAGSMASFFKDCVRYVSISLEGMDTSEVTSMASMFDGCSALTSIDLTGLNTAEVRNMSKMFYGCIGLTSLVLDTDKDVNGKFVNFNTANVTDMSYMFSSTALDGSGADTKKMNIESLDVSGLDTSSVTNMSHMFYLCSNSNLTTLDVSGFNTSKVTDMSYMFACWRNFPSYVTAVDMSGWDFSKVTTVNRMFDRCERVVISFPTLTKLSNIEDILYWFSHCFAMTPARLATVIGSWDFSGHTNVSALSALFAVCDDNNGEVSPNNRIMTNDMNNYKSTRQVFDTHQNNTVITKLYVGGNNLSNVRDQRLTTVQDPYSP